MTVEIKIELEGMTDTLVYYRSRSAVSINNIVFIWSWEKPGNPLDKKVCRYCSFY